MRGRAFPLLLIPLISACFGTEQPAAHTATHQQSRVLAFRRTAVMDTVTAILEGQVVSLCIHRPVPASVRLTNVTATYQRVAAPDGRFQFFHIQAGDYTLTTTCPAYYTLPDTRIHLGTGDAAVTTIGMSCHLGR
jgi:hypothetical protein